MLSSPLACALTHLRLLTKSTLDINATNEQREGAVHEAASMGHMDVVWKLISAGAALGARGSDAVSGLVYAAVQHDTTDLLSLLQKRGILDVEAASHGRSPLVEAVRQGHTASVEWLIQAGANVSAPTANGESALAVAAFEDRFPLVWRLHEAGGAPPRAALHLTTQLTPLLPSLSICSCAHAPVRCRVGCWLAQRRFSRRTSTAGRF